MSRKKKPWIGITCDVGNGPEGLHHLRREYIEAIFDLGGLPLLLSALPDVRGKEVAALVDPLDGVLISGGDYDVEPGHYGERPLCELPLNPVRAHFELLLAREVVRRDMPTLGVCGGCQVLNVAAGGTLYQDIPSQVSGALAHKSRSGRHEIAIEPQSQLAKMMTRRKLKVNTSHHQAIKKVAPGFQVSARAPDGIIEAIERSKPFVLGVQWHPENLYRTDRAAVQLFEAFLRAASKFGRSRKPSSPRQISDQKRPSSR